MWGVIMVKYNSGPYLNKGDCVTIYEDPFTEQQPLGKAKLLTFRAKKGVVNGRLLELWDVHMCDESYDIENVAILSDYIIPPDLEVV